jgi:hypothetical protein
MTGIDTDQATKLLTNYNCCFLKSGDQAKLPEGTAWQKKPRRPAEYRGQGIGILCGPLRDDLSIHCLDVDAKHPELSQRFKSWLQYYLQDKQGVQLQRIGLPPKFLVPFVCAEELRKSDFTTKRFYPADEQASKASANQLEVLGKGNQFVAYQIHPDTGQPYQWGTLDGTPFDEDLYLHEPDHLLVLNGADLTVIKAAFERICSELGLVLEQAQKTPPAPPAAPTTGNSDLKGQPMKPEQAQSYLDAIPNSGEGQDYDTWLGVGMAIKQELGNSGLPMFMQWSRQSSKHDDQTAQDKWDSFKGGNTAGAFLGNLAKQCGWRSSADKTADQFQNLVATSVASADEDEVFSLDAFALNGSSHEMEAQMLADEFVLEPLALMGQWSVIYAQPNKGKTLLTISMLIKAISEGRINGADVYYINADDTHKGVTQKLKLAEKHGFKMLAPGYNGFDSNKLGLYLKRLSDQGDAHGKVLILDTLKKFTDLMDKKVSSDFGKLAREFVGKGGTVISLAHVNKKRDDEGKVIMAGTSDVNDDADCSYTLDEITTDPISHMRLVAFENQKNRGDVAMRVVYEYDCNPGTNYADKLESVRQVDDGEIKEAEKRADRERIYEINREIVDAIKEVISGGTTTRTEIIKQAAEIACVSKAKVKRALEKHTGTSIVDFEFWNVGRGEKNAQIYSLNWGV